MANENDGILKTNYDENSQLNCNNNETSESSSNCKNNSLAKNEKEKCTKTKNSGGFGGIPGDYKNIRATNSDVINLIDQQQTPLPQPQRREENPFSFKHFLNRDTSNAHSNPTNPTATIVSSSSNLINSNLASSNNVSNIITGTSNLPPSSSSVFSFNFSGNDIASSVVGSNNLTNNNGDITYNSVSGSSQSPLSSAPTASNNLASSISNNSGLGLGSSSPYQTSTGARPKVPQSMSTSSSIGSAGNNQQPPTSVSTTSMSSLGGGETSKMKRSPRFSSFDSQASLAECAAGTNNDRIGSTINNSMSGGFLRDGAGILDDPGKPLCNTSGLFITNSDYDKQFVPRSYSNYDIDLPPSLGRSSTNSNNIRSNENSSPLRRNSPAVRPNRLSGITSQSPNSKNQYQPSSSSTSGRPNSEFAAALPDFVQDHWMDPWYYNEMHLNSPPNSPIQSPIDFVEDLPAGMAVAEKCQTLPDFLSDGPIIHSSGRLADVAAGLPDLDSPEDNSPSLQLSRIRLENKRLRRELDESRISLAEQTRRAGELERRLEQARCNELTLNRNLAQNIGQVEENLDQSKKRTAAAQNQVSKLKQQVKQLTAEVEVLRRENDSLREEGAVGGDRITRRPSRTQQLSRELMRAASNAESNLRQLLSGVENLRLMARSIGCDDDDEECIDYDLHSPSSAAAAAAVINNSGSANLINDEYLSDCDDFDDFSGPAL